MAETACPCKRSVVVAVDASEHSRGAFDYYMQEIWRPDDMVVIAHVPEVPHLPTFSFKHGIAPPVDEWEKAITTQIAKVQKLEEDYTAECIIKKCHYKVLATDLEKIIQTNLRHRGEHFAHPGEGIVAIAEAEKASLVVMGTRGLDFIRRNLLGSMSDYVVHHSKAPVLVWRKP